MVDIAKKDIRGITIEINGDVSKLDKALASVDKDLSTTQQHLRDVERLLKLDPGNVELLDQKQRLLAKSVELTGKRYETLKKTLSDSTASNVAAEKWASAQAGFSAEITKTEKALTRLKNEQVRMQGLHFAPDGAEMQDLQRRIDETRDRAEQLRAKAAETFEQLGRPISIDQYDALQRELAQSKLDMEAAQKAAAGLDEGLEETGNEGETTGGILGKLNDKLGGKLGLATTAAAGAAGIAIAAKAIKEFAEFAYDATKEAAAFADEILTLSQQTGFDSEFLQGLDYASGLIDVSTESIVSSMRKLKNNLDSDSADVRAAFERIGVIPEQLQASGVSIQDTFRIVISALSGVHSELERDQIAMTLFGRSADDLAGVIDDGGQKLYAYIQTAREMGYVLSGEELSALGAVDDAFYKLDKSIEMAKKRMAVELAPTVVDLTERIVTFIETADWEQFGRSASIVLRDVIPMMIDLANAIMGAANAAAALIELLDRIGRSSTDNIRFRNDGTIREIPGYASGGVFEPNNPMLIAVGDNKTEREVIAPESMIRRIVREEAGGAGGGRIQMLQPVFTASDSQLVRILAPMLEAYTELRGNVI